MGSSSSVQRGQTAQAGEATTAAARTNGKKKTKKQAKKEEKEKKRQKKRQKKQHTNKAAQQQQQQQEQQFDENSDWAVLIHARQDFPVAKRLLVELRQVGVHIKAISPLSKHKLKAEDACLVLALLSPSFLKTKQCMRSLQTSLQCTVPWIPLTLQDDFSADKFAWLRNALHRVTPHPFAVTNGRPGGPVDDQAFYSQLVKLLPLLSRYPVGAHIQRDASAEDEEASDLTRVVGIIAAIQGADETACEQALLQATDMAFVHADRQHLHNAGALKACFAVFDTHTSSPRLIAFATYALVALLSDAGSNDDLVHAAEAVARQSTSNLQRYASSRDIVLQSLILLQLVLDNDQAFAASAASASAPALPSALPATVARLAVQHVAEEGILVQALFVLELLQQRGHSSLSDADASKLNTAIADLYDADAFPRQVAAARLPVITTAST